MFSPRRADGGHASSRRTAGDEHGDRAEPFRPSCGWGIYTMVDRTAVNGVNHNRHYEDVIIKPHIALQKITGSYWYLIEFYP